MKSKEKRSRENDEATSTSQCTRVYRPVVVHYVHFQECKFRGATRATGRLVGLGMMANKGVICLAGGLVGNQAPQVLPHGRQSCSFTAY